MSILPRRKYLSAKKVSHKRLFILSLKQIYGLLADVLIKRTRCALGEPGILSNETNDQL
jgi:hypothetical protein